MTKIKLIVNNTVINILIVKHMKKLSVNLSIIALVAFFSNTAFAQCTTEEFEKKCVDKVNQLGFTFLKSYKIDGENKTKIEYQYIFTKGSNYLVTIASKDTDNKGVVLNLYDSNRKLVVSNHENETKKYMAGLSYACNTTGIYYLSFTFENTRDKCAASVLGFKKQ